MSDSGATNDKPVESKEPAQRARTHWRLSGYEFSMLWESIGRERLPYPLQFQADVMTHSDYVRQRRFAASRLSEIVDESLHSALGLLAEPQLRIELAGYKAGSPLSSNRVYVGIRGAAAAVIEQVPTYDPANTGGDVEIMVGPARSVAEKVVSSIGTTQAGRGNLSLDRAPGQELSLWNPPSHNSPAEVREFFDRPRQSVGEISVFAGPEPSDGYPIGGSTFFWMDFAKDGRYLVTAGDTVEAHPATSDALAAELDRSLGLIREITARES